MSVFSAGFEQAPNGLGALMLVRLASAAGCLCTSTDGLYLTNKRELEEHEDSLWFKVEDWKDTQQLIRENEAFV